MKNEQANQQFVENTFHDIFISNFKYFPWQKKKLFLIYLLETLNTFHDILISNSGAKRQFFPPLPPAFPITSLAVHLVVIVDDVDDDVDDDDDDDDE